MCGNRKYHGNPHTSTLSRQGSWIVLCGVSVRDRAPKDTAGRFKVLPLTVDVYVKRVCVCVRLYEWVGILFVSIVSTITSAFFLLLCALEWVNGGLLRAHKVFFFAGV